MKKRRHRQKNWLNWMRPSKLWLSWKKWLKVSLVILGIILLVVWLASDYWQVKKTSCVVNGEPCRAGLWTKMYNLASQKNILLLSVHDLSSKIRAEYPEIFEVKIVKKLPHQLDFEISLRKPVVAIQRSVQNFLLVDEEGYVVEISQDKHELPVITGAGNINSDLGDQVGNSNLVQAVSILSESQWRGLTPQEAYLNQDWSLTVVFPNEIMVLFSIENNPSEQLDSLQFILERLKIEGRQPQEIDLRFDKPVLRE